MSFRESRDMFRYFLYAVASFPPRGLFKQPLLLEEGREAFEYGASMFFSRDVLKLS